MVDDAARRAWLEKVLGVQFGADAGPDATPPLRTLAVWAPAKDAVDDQLRSLSDHLSKTGVPALAELSAEVASLLQPLQVKLISALNEYDAAPNQSRSRATALSLIGDAAAWLKSDERVHAVDANPFGIKVSAARILGDALAHLKKELQGATA